MAKGIIDSVTVTATLSKPDDIRKLFKLLKEVEEQFKGIEEQIGADRKDGDNDKL